MSLSSVSPVDENMCLSVSLFHIIKYKITVICIVRMGVQGEQKLIECSGFVVRYNAGILFIFYNKFKLIFILNITYIIAFAASPRHTHSNTFTSTI